MSVSGQDEDGPSDDSAMIWLDVCQGAYIRRDECQGAYFRWAFVKSLCKAASFFHGREFNLLIFYMSFLEVFWVRVHCIQGIWAVYTIAQMLVKLSAIRHLGDCWQFVLMYFHVILPDKDIQQKFFKLVTRYFFIKVFLLARLGRSSAHTWSFCCFFRCVKKPESWPLSAICPFFSFLLAEATIWQTTPSWSWP